MLGIILSVLIGDFAECVVFQAVTRVLISSPEPLVFLNGVFVLSSYAAMPWNADGADRVGSGSLSI